MSINIESPREDDMTEAQQADAIAAWWASWSTWRKVALVSIWCGIAAILGGVAALLDELTR
jgi:hypothetical protein